MKNNKEYFMNLAIEEAQKGLTTTFPNPAVGCVIVKDNKVIAKGYHHKAGEPHAEIEALKQIDFDATDCDVYVTLEPCNHHGKTPPCTEALIKANAKKVVISVQDPNPQVDGSGIKRLKDANIDVEVGVLENDGKNLLKYFTHQIKNKLPFITLKAAVSLNGYINKNQGQRTILTGNLAYENTLKLRKEHDAVLIGGNTVFIDNPSFKGITKIILSSRELPNTLNIFKNNDKVIQYKSVGVGLVPNPEDLKGILQDLYNKGIGSIFVEGGNSIFNQFIQENLFNELILYFAPKMFSKNNNLTSFYNGNIDVDNLKIKEIKQLDDDIMIRYQNIL
jgi:diaminohydroxyphosphoribosylaminopyrimidine deaminase/5-amino-6-(5-phosphoribosylamino)uracil reductase